VFWFLLVTLVVVVAAVTLVVVGGDDGVALRDAQPDRLHAPLPGHRPVGQSDVEALRLPMTVRGYRMTDVDGVLGRLGAELAERDAQIAELRTALAGARTAPAPHEAAAEHGERADRGAAPADDGSRGNAGHGGPGAQTPGDERNHGDDGPQA
jgi:hypothetical protein